MKNLMEKKTFGSVLVLFAAILEAAGLISFCLWAPAHKAFNPAIPLALAAGLILTVVLWIRDMDLVMVLIAASYSFAMIWLLMDSVGSFVDKYQNIVMFGDATQVGTIIKIAALMGAGILLAIVAAFTHREKD